ARFVEIKTDGDQLRRNQLLRLEQLKKAGFRAEVVLVRWVLSAAQPYVVVDVETTGGRGDQHRVTEIGAVKILNGKIVDRFQTLLNPQRRIPSNITRLTGISPDMVADAPIFADVADEFAAFLDGAIFVAHNVEFDYRFIGQEFRRLGRFFRMPKLCTCASMRKLYPGHKSYSLANLTSAYDIPLKTHHRALCDAEAAAHLLLMINEKRSEQLQSSEA
ncbi:MAG: exonuclease domain-containing protein, partial [Pseudomonadota bacterium]